MPIDYSKYPPNWKTEIRPRILARAGSKCEFCGVENKAVGWNTPSGFVYAPDYAKAMQAGVGFYAARFLDKRNHDGRITVVLTIAHLDHDEHNHEVSDERLAALCQACHLKYDAPEKARRRKAKKLMQSPTLF